MSLEADGVISIYEIETGKLIAVYEGLDVHYEVERLREVERKALEQSEYIQKHGLTEWEMALKNAEIKRLRAALREIIAESEFVPAWDIGRRNAINTAKAALDAAGVSD